MEPTARLLDDYLKHLDPHPGLGADAAPLFHGPNHSRLTRSGIAIKRESTRSCSIWTCVGHGAREAHAFRYA